MKEREREKERKKERDLLIQLEVARNEMSDALVVCNSLNTEAEARKKNAEMMQSEFDRKCGTRLCLV